MPHILAIDDEFEVLDTVRWILEDEGFEVTTTQHPVEGWQLIKKLHPDLVVLDVIMPEMTGIELCRRLRSSPYVAQIPILFLTAKGQADDIVHGLDVGGDDYLTKPFEMIELPARVRALLRRATQGLSAARESAISVGKLELSLQHPEIKIEDRIVSLTTVEYRLLYYLALNTGQPRSIEDLLRDVWEYPGGDGNQNIVHVTIKRLRDKIEPVPEAPRYLRNIWGEGYVLNG